MFYLEVFNDKPLKVKEELIKCIEWCLKQTEVPGATKKECGNYKSHDLLNAQVYLLKYQAVLLGRFYSQP